MHGLPMCLSGDEIVGVSLLEPAGEEHGTSPTPEEEAILLGEEPKPLKASEATSLLEHLEIPETVEPTEQINTPTFSAPLSPMPTPRCHTSHKTKKSQEWMEANPNHTSKWVCFYVQKNKLVPTWWREFQSLLCSMDKCFGNVQVKGMAHWPAVAFRLPATQLEMNSWWTIPPCLGVLGSP